MVKRYKMPCFEKDRHGLEEDPRGYIVQASDYDALVTETNNLRNEVESLRRQLTEALKAAADAAKDTGKKKAPVGKWAIKIPIDEEDWIFVTDLSEGGIQTYPTKAEAEKAGTTFGQFRIEKLR
jgi:hypothetical protein